MSVDSSVEWVAMVREARYSPEPEYVLLSQRAMELLGRSHRMTRMMWQVLAMALAGCEWGNRVALNQSEMARRMGWNTSSINRAIRRLVDLGVLVRVKEPGRHADYYLNPFLVTKARTRADRERLRAEYGVTLRVGEAGEG